jgi:hypothetical protein
MASFASSGNPFATTRPQQMPDFGSAPYGHDGYNMDESESDEGMDTEELERQVILMVNRRIHEKLNESSSESEEEENSGESMDEYGEVEKKKKKKKKRKKKSNPPLWGAGQFVDHGDFTRFNGFSARQQPYPYHPAMPSHDSALASKIDVIIEQNKHLQSIVKQQSEQLNSKVIGQNAGGALQQAPRKSPKKKRRKKKKKKEDSDSSSDESNDVAPEFDQRFAPVDPNTYHYTPGIESGGAKSDELAKTEKWFVSQFAGRKSKRRAAISGGKQAFADQKVKDIGQILNLKDEDEILFEEEKKKEVIKKQENKDEMRRQLEKKLGIVQVRKPRWRHFWRSMPDAANPGQYKMAWTEDVLEEKEGLVCTECRQNHPTYVKKLAANEPPEETIMKGKSLFKSLCNVSIFLTRLKIVDRNRRKDSVEKDRAAFKEFMLLYYDKVKNWLGKVVKAPVGSLILERTEKYNLDTKDDGNTFGGIKKMLQKITGGGNKDTKERKLMQLKVRVKGIVDQLMASCKTKAEGASRASQLIPKEIIDFLAKYFASDNVAWPQEYLWKCEEDEMEFSELGITRRMITKKSNDEEKEGDDKDDDSDSDEEEDIIMKMDGLDTSKVRRLLLNFLIGRVLINHVIVRPGEVPTIGVRSHVDDFSWNGLRIKKNLRMLASLLWHILWHVEGHDELQRPENSGNYVEGERHDSSAEKTKHQAERRSKDEKKKAPKLKPKLIVVEYKKDEDFDFEIDENNRSVQSDIEEDSVEGKNSLQQGDKLVKIGTKSVVKMKHKGIQDLLQKSEKKRPIKLHFERHEVEKEKTEDDGKGSEENKDSPPQKKEDEKYTSLWLRETDIESKLFDESHYIFGDDDHLDAFDDWVLDEADRLKSFGNRLVEEILRAKERMKKEEEAEKEKEEKE